MKSNLNRTVIHESSGLGSASARKSFHNTSAKPHNAPNLGPICECWWWWRLMKEIPNNHLGCIEPYKNPVKNGISISTGAGFLPSTVSRVTFRLCCFTPHPFHLMTIARALQKGSGSCIHQPKGFKN